jgi:hypothetical protein
MSASTTSSSRSRARRRPIASDVDGGVVRLAYTAIPPNTPPRPYVTLELRGPSSSPFTLIGLLDTGADFSTLPLDVAIDLGFRTAALRPTAVHHATGSAILQRADEPITARLAGMATEFLLDPMYAPVPGEEPRDVLWGRRDFLRHWDLWLSESNERFDLNWRP